MHSSTANAAVVRHQWAAMGALPFPPGPMLGTGGLAHNLELATMKVAYYHTEEHSSS